jgi:ketosteroid isomerase-like protein
MSQGNVEVVRAGFEAFDRGDWNHLLGLLDPGVEWETTAQFVEGGSLPTGGRARVPRFACGEFEEFRARADNFADRGELVVADVHTTGIGRRSGAPAAVDFTLLASLRGGRLVRPRNFMNRSEALEAAGLSE